MARRKHLRTYPDLPTYFKESGDTQVAFAERINRSQPWLSKVISKDIEPGIADALVIAQEAGVPLESLIVRPAAISRT